MSLRLYLDEDVSVLLAVRLSRDGYDVLTTLQAGRAHERISDNEQLEYAASQGRAIFTHSIRDFQKLAQESAAAGRPHAGIILGDRRLLESFT